MIKRLFILFLFIIFMLQNSTGFRAFADNTAADKSEEILIILDFSASMNKQLNDKTRARYVLLSLYSALSSLPKDTKIGLRVFGPDNNYKSVMPNDVHTFHDCNATYLIAPIKSNNIQNIKDRLSEYTQPFGQTPIELSLRRAIENDFLTSDSVKRIILVTDGTDTCGGNPCKYIKSVASKRKDIVINVISIADSKGNYGNLSCLSKSTNGSYQVVRSSDDLLSSLKTTLKVEESLKTNLNDPVLDIKQDEIEYSNYLFEINY